MCKKCALLLQLGQIEVRSRSYNNETEPKFIWNRTGLNPVGMVYNRAWLLRSHLYGNETSPRRKTNQTSTQTKQVWEQFEMTFEQIRLFSGVHVTSKLITIHPGNRIHTDSHNQSLLWLSSWAPRGRPLAESLTRSESGTRWGCRPSAEHLWTGLFCWPVR